MLYEIQNYFEDYFKYLYKHISNIDEKDLKNFIKIILDSTNKGNKILIAGNGGSASIASHVSVDFVKAAGLKCVNFNEPNLITCFSNDYGYEEWISKALEVYSEKNDLLILISSSGTSKNILNAAKTSNKKGLKLVTFSGFESNNPLRQLGDLNFWVNSKSYNYVEMSHHIWLVAVVDFLTKKNKQ